MVAVEGAAEVVVVEVVAVEDEVVVAEVCYIQSHSSVVFFIYLFVCRWLCLGVYIQRNNFKNIQTEKALSKL